MEHEHGLILAPGAGASSDSPALIAIEKALPSDWIVHRMDFPYRLAGRKAPDKPEVLLHAVRVVTDAFSEKTGIPRDKIFVGGRSMGGRIFSMAVADGMEVAGLVLMSYPLHPPGRPEKLRTEHFPQVDVPTLFVSGDRDAFGTPDEIKTHTDAIPGELQWTFIEGGDHGMNKFTADVTETVIEWLLAETSNH